MKQVNYVKWTEFLSYAATIGYTWNQAHEILVRDEVPPMYETKTRDYSTDDLDEYGWSEDSLKIVKGFMEKNNVKEILVTE